MTDRFFHACACHTRLCKFVGISSVGITRRNADLPQCIHVRIHTHTRAYKRGATLGGGRLLSFALLHERRVSSAVSSSSRSERRLKNAPSYVVWVVDDDDDEHSVVLSRKSRSRLSNGRRTRVSQPRRIERSTAAALDLAANFTGRTHYRDDDGRVRERRPRRYPRGLCSPRASVCRACCDRFANAPPFGPDLNVCVARFHSADRLFIQLLFVHEILGDRVYECTKSRENAVVAR